MKSLKTPGSWPCLPQHSGWVAQMLIISSNSQHCATATVKTIGPVRFHRYLQKPPTKNAKNTTSILSAPETKSGNSTHGLKRGYRTSKTARINKRCFFPITKFLKLLKHGLLTEIRLLVRIITSLRSTISTTTERTTGKTEIIPGTTLNKTNSATLTERFPSTETRIFGG